MKRLTWLVMISTVGMLLTPLISGAANFLPERSTPVPANQQIPVVDFVRPLLFERPMLNPAGTHFAAYSKNEELLTIVMICEIATGKVSWTLGGIEVFEWIDNTHFMLNYSENQVFDIKQPERHVPFFTVTNERKRGLNPETGFLWLWPLDSRSPPFGHEENYWCHPENGEPAYCEVMQKDGKIRLYRYDNKWVECPVNLDEIEVLGISDQADEVYVLPPCVKGTPRPIQRLDTKSGVLGEIVYQDPQFDCVGELFYKRGTRHIVGAAVPGRPTRVVWFDPVHQQVQDMINRQFPKQLVQIASSDMAENIFIIKVESDRQPPVYYVLDLQKKSLGLLKNTAPWIDPGRMQPTQLISYKARDGTVMDGLLTLPAGASREHPVPLLVSTKAGPWNYVTRWGWDGSSQLVANRGYAVFEPNYRGTNGYTSRFDQADRFDFQKMSEDITDGTHALLKSGLIDPNRVAIDGIGFGGYLAMCAVLDEPALYRCAMLFGGIYDWEKLFKKKDSSTMYADLWMERRLSNYHMNPPSPLKRSKEIKIPVFFTRNLQIGDTTYETQIFDLYLALHKQVACVNFGDLNIYTDNEAISEVVTRMTKLDEFMATHMPAK